MAQEIRLSPYTSQDFNECEETKSFILDFAYRCNQKRVDPFVKIILMALGFVPDSNTADVKASNQAGIAKLPNLSSHVLKSPVREYDIPQHASRQYAVTLDANVASDAGMGPQTDTWTLGTTIDTTSTYNDSFFVRDYAVGYLYDSSDPVNVAYEMVLIVGRDTTAGTIDVIRNHDSAGRPMLAWSAGTKILLGENAIPELLPDCHISCEAILSPCCDKGYIQGFKHCQKITKEYLMKPVYSPFAKKEQEAYRQQMDGFIDELTNTLYSSQPSKFIDASSGTPNYTMAGLEYFKTFFQDLVIDSCCPGALDEAIASLADDPVSADFDNTNIYIGLASRQFMQYLRQLHRDKITIFQSLDDFKGISPEGWEVARTLGFAGVLAYAGDGFYIIFLESTKMTAIYPFRCMLLNYGTLYLTTIPEMTESFQGQSFRYGGFMRRINENNSVNIESSFCEVTIGYEAFLGMEIFCAASNAMITVVECDCASQLVLGPTDDFPNRAEEDSGAVDLEEEEIIT